MIPARSLTVSCQAEGKSPFNAPHYLRAFAQAAILGGADGVHPLAEGRVPTPAEAQGALARGVYAVVVGSVITRPERLTASFTASFVSALRGRPLGS